MSFFGKVKDIFVKAKAKASEILKKLFGDEAAQKFADGAAAMLKTATGKVVLQVVAAMLTLKIDGQPATGEQKKAEAFKKIVEILGDQAQTIGTSLINTLIEMSVQALVKKTIQLPDDVIAQLPSDVAQLAR